MKRWVAAIAVALMVIGSWALMGQNQAQALDLTYTLPSSSLLAVSERLNAADKKLIEIRDKIDLNNSDVRDFRRYRGFYPNLASKIIQNAPYEKPED
ncbi:MAG: photosystem II protein, partial [Cyanobacteria bacterium J083]